MTSKYVHYIVSYCYIAFNKLTATGIVRNKLKIQATVTNAIVFMKIQQEHGSFDNFIWNYVNFKPIVNHHNELSDVPAKTELSETISKNLKKLGFKFLGPTSVYAFMQALGLVNDHMDYCFLKQDEAKN